MVYNIVCFPFIFISWRLITLQYCSGFCQHWHESAVDLHVSPSWPQHHMFHVYSILTNVYYSVLTSNNQVPICQHTFDPLYPFFRPLPLFPSVGGTPICSLYLSVFLVLFMYLFFSMLHEWNHGICLSPNKWLISLNCPQVHPSCYRWQDFSFFFFRFFFFND